MKAEVPPMKPAAALLELFAFWVLPGILMSLLFWGCSSRDLGELPPENGSASREASASRKASASGADCRSILKAPWDELTDEEPPRSVGALRHQATASMVLENRALRATVTRTEGGAYLDLRSASTGAMWVRGQPLFAWKFLDGRGAMTSLSGWSGVSIGGKAITFNKPGIEVETVLELCPGESPLEVSTSYRDLSSDPSLRSPCESFALRLTPPDADAVELLAVRKGTTNPDVLELSRLRLAAGAARTFLCSGSDSRDDDDWFPWFCFQLGSCSGAYFGWEFSGYGKFEARRDADAIVFGGGLEPEKFVRRGSVDLPAWFVGLYEGDEDDGANQLHRWWMEHRFPKTGDPLYPRIHYNTWTALGTSVDESKCLQHIQMAKTLGAELFHLDAGWYRGVDDWVADPVKFPNGLRPIVEAAHRAGLKFGLWTAPNHAGPRLHRLHPDWIVHDWMIGTPEFKEAGTSDAFSAAPMCWGHRPCEEYLALELERIVREYELDYLEHDQPIVLDCLKNEAHTHRLGGGQYEIVRAYYRTYDGLRRKFPDLILEDCMNGGHLMDYGAMARFQVISITDLYGPDQNRKAVWGATFPMPPSYCESYMEDAPDLPPHYQFRSFMMGLWSLSADTTRWSPEKVEACRKDIAAYKRIRPILRDGNVYHILPQPDGKRWDGLQYYHPGWGYGVVFVFRPDSDVPSQTVRPRGLDGDSRYRVSFEDSPAVFAASGSELMSRGIKIDLPQKFGSEIVYVEREGARG